MSSVNLSHKTAFRSSTEDMGFDRGGGGRRGGEVYCGMGALPKQFFIAILSCIEMSCMEMFCIEMSFIEIILVCIQEYFLQFIQHVTMTHSPTVLILQSINCNQQSRTYVLL